MICKICEVEFGDLSQNIGTCPECLVIILAHSVPEPTCERCDLPIGDGKGCKPRLCIDCTNDDFDGSTCEECGADNATAEDDGLCPECRDKEADDGTGDGEFGSGIDAEEGPEDEDLVTSDYETFFRFGMGKVAFEVPRDDDWQPHAKAYMEKEQYWPDIWEAGERGGYTNITTEVT